jgi:hypothetical protein
MQWHCKGKTLTFAATKIKKWILVRVEAFSYLQHSANRATLSHCSGLSGANLLSCAKEKKSTP